MPSLKILLTRGTAQAITAASIPDYLFQQFNVEKHPSLPTAAVMALGESLPVNNDIWLHCQPVHLQADHKAAYLIESITLRDNEADSLRHLLNGFLEPLSMSITVSPAGNWYLHGASIPPLTAIPVDAAIGKNLSGLLPRDSQGAFWRTLFTEIQMLLHTSDVNHTRRMAGDLDVNGLWFWGAGKLPVVHHNHWQTIWSDDPLATGLGGLSGVKVETLPRDYSVCEFPEPGKYLMVLSERQLPQLEDAWLKNALRSLRLGQITELTVYWGGARQVQLTKSLLSRWWRRRQQIGID